MIAAPLLARHDAARQGWLIIIVALAWLVPVALAMPVNHDEGQYVAAAYFVARGLLPYRDFAYLQAPLQPFAYAPLALLFPGWSLVATRFANALASALAAALIGCTATALSADRRVGWLAAALVLTTDAVLFGASVARNDALPLALFALSLERLFATAAPGKGRVAVAGLAVALAASTKLSYAFPAAAMLVMALAHVAARDGRRPGAVAALIGGMALGGSPILIALALEPHIFWFDAVSYSIDAVIAWQALIDASHRLALTVRLREFGLLMMLGPALWLLVAVAATRARESVRPLGISLYPLTLAAILGAFLPMPVYRHYLIPMVAPLVLLGAVNAAAIAERLRHRPRKARLLALVVAMSLVAGVGRTVGWALTKPLDTRPLSIEHAARRVGDTARASGAASIAGLDPLMIVDSGVAFDPRFAPGPFLFRAGNLAICRDRGLCAVTYRDLSAITRRPPGAVLTGTERRAPDGIRGGLDGVLDRWARADHYQSHALANRQMLWISPLETIRPAIAQP